jgi:hypothetical protein
MTSNKVVILLFIPRVKVCLARHGHTPTVPNFIPLRMRLTFTILLFLWLKTGHAQEQTDELSGDTKLKDELLALRADVNTIQLNLGKSERRFKTGIAVATLGYSITIAGGLMLGRKHDELGKALLITGGATGITGTFLMVDAFKFLGRAARRKGV